MTTNRVAAYLPADRDEPCAGCKYALRELAIANATLDEAHRIEECNRRTAEAIAERERDESRACLGAVVVFLAGVLLFVASLMVRFG